MSERHVSMTIQRFDLSLPRIDVDDDEDEDDDVDPSKTFTR